MKNLPQMPDDYFEKFRVTPVSIKLFDPKSKQIANEYLDFLHKLLKNHGVKILHRGSTAFGISGKGDIEIGVYPSSNSWSVVIESLKNYFGEPGGLEDDYARFNTKKDNYEIEIIVLKGEPASVDIALTNYLMNHPNLLKEYEKVKNEYSYSKREYQIHKDRFFSLPRGSAA